MNTVHNKMIAMDKTNSPSQRRYEKNRQSILEAARAIVSEQGIGALSMRALADRVDYSASALYKYFKDKEEILDALSTEAWRFSMEYGERHPPATSDPLDILRQSGRNIYEFAKQYPAQYQLMMTASKSSPKSLDEFMEYPSFKGLRMLLAEAVQAGKLRLPEGFTPDLLAFHMWFVIHGASMARLTITRNFGPEIDELVDRLGGALNTLLKPD